jgi:hypothetical protein
MGRLFRSDRQVQADGFINPIDHNKRTKTMTTDENRHQAGTGVSTLWSQLPTHPTNDPAGVGVYYDPASKLRCGCDAPFFRRGVCINHDLSHQSESLRDERRAIEREGDIDGDEYKALLQRENENRERRAKADRIIHGTVWTRELAQAYGLETYSPLTDAGIKHRYRNDKSDRDYRASQPTIEHTDIRVSDGACLQCLDVDAYNTRKDAENAERAREQAEIRERQKAEAEAKKRADEAQRQTVLRAQMSVAVQRAKEKTARRKEQKQRANAKYLAKIAKEGKPSPQRKAEKKYYRSNKADVIERATERNRELRSTPEGRAAFNAYMREYRAKQRAGRKPGPIINT